MAIFSSRFKTQRIATFMILLVLGASTPLSQTALADSMDQATAIRQQLKEFETAWNDGDVAKVINQYHTSVHVLVRSEHWDYDKEVSYLKSFMSEKKRPVLRFDVDFIRPIGPTYTLINGRFHLSAADGTEQSGVFSAVWMRVGDTWQCIYSHS